MRCINAAMTLAEYLSKHEITDEAFAAKVGLSQSQISRLKRGKSRPSWPALAAITSVTGGKVTADDFFPGMKSTRKRRAAA